MKVEELMTKDVFTCHPNDTLNAVAQIMWERDCGCVPVVNHDGVPIAMVTDRDICMASYTQGKPLMEIPVAVAMSKNIVVCRANESLATAESIMRAQRVRRVPVVADDGKIVGLLSLNDLATHRHGKRRLGVTSDALGGDAIAMTLAAICARAPMAEAAE